MKIALVHDYIKEYGGAERVLEALSEIWPEAPIYTAFWVKNSTAGRAFAGKKIIPSWANWFLPWKNLYSPLRFLTPWIWESFDFRGYDIVISSASWYITKGIKTPPGTLHLCYCHTPPRWLYGYKTSIEWQRFWPVKVYGLLVGHFMRMYDFSASQKVDYFIANSKEVKERIKKFYRREAVVIYPPGELPKISKEMLKQVQHDKKEEYYFIVSRIVGSKGLDLAVETAVKMGLKLKIAGVPGGYYTEHKKLLKKANNNIEFLGFVTDKELANLYAKAKVFLALAEDEDFGITPVEAMSMGTPVIAYKGGGYKETVIDGKTGVFFDELSIDSLTKAIQHFNDMYHHSEFNPHDCIAQAQKFSKDRFKKEIEEFVETKRREYKMDKKPVTLKAQKTK